MDANDLGRRVREDSPGRQMAPPPAQLPDDLIYVGILPRLPFRSLVRFAVACKVWHRLILGDPAFARAQARSPSPASAVLARYHRGRLDILTPGASAVAPPDASLSFLPFAGAKLRFCSATSGLLCLIVNPTVGGVTFFVVNPATRAFRAVPYPYAAEDGRRACLAYDPSMVHRKGYSIVVPVKETLETCRFWSFSSAVATSSGGCVWRVSGPEVRLTPCDFVRSKPLYLGGRAHWLCDLGGVVWHDAGADTVGALPPPFWLLAGGGRCVEGNRELVAWHGRIGMVYAGISSGLAVWALPLSSSSSPTQWEMVHCRQWDEIPGVPRPTSRRFLWSVVPAGMEGGGEKALGLAVRTAHGPRRHKQQHGVDGAGRAAEEDVWCRQLLRYDMRTGATAVVAELVGKEVHDDFGAVFGYHSSMAPLN